MNLRFSRRARKYLAERKVEVVTVGLLEASVGDTVGVIKETTVSLRPPPNPEGFWLRRAEGVTVYIDSRLKLAGEVVIRRQGFGRFSSLYADGILVPL